MPKKLKHFLGYRDREKTRTRTHTHNPPPLSLSEPPIEQDFCVICVIPDSEVSVRVRKAEKLLENEKRLLPLATLFAVLHKAKMGGCEIYSRVGFVRGYIDADFSGRDLIQNFPISAKLEALSR